MEESPEKKKKMQAWIRVLRLTYAADKLQLFQLSRQSGTYSPPPVALPYSG